MWVPASPLPDLSLPDMDENEQVSGTIVAVSVKTTVLLLPEKLPPGVTDQVVVVMAREGGANRPMARTVAARPVPNRVPYERFRMTFRSFRAAVPEARLRSFCSGPLSGR